MSTTIMWICIAIVMAIIEINILTFYLLCLAVGSLVGALLSALGFDFSTQCLFAGIVTIICAIATVVLRKKLKRNKDHNNNNLDVDQYVEVKEEDLKDNGCARVMYRGTTWMAFCLTEPLKPGIYQIEKVDGTRLVLKTIQTNNVQ